MRENHFILPSTIIVLILLIGYYIHELFGSNRIIIQQIWREKVFWCILLALVLSCLYILMTAWNTAKSGTKNPYKWEILVVGIAVFVLLLQDFLVNYGYSAKRLVPSVPLISLQALMWINVAMRERAIDVPAQYMSRFLIKVPLLGMVIFVFFSHYLSQAINVAMAALLTILSVFFVMRKRETIGSMSCLIIYAILISCGFFIQVLSELQVIGNFFLMISDVLFILAWGACFKRLLYWGRNL